MRPGSGSVRLAYSEVSGRLYFTDWQAGSISVIDVQQSTSPQPIITGLNEPLPITAHPIHRCNTPSRQVLHLPSFGYHGTQKFLFRCCSAALYRGAEYCRHMSGTTCSIFTKSLLRVTCVSGSFFL